jgi:2-haloacid dehalogenase
VVHRARRCTYREFDERVNRLSSALILAGLRAQSDAAPPMVIIAGTAQTWDAWLDLRMEVPVADKWLTFDCYGTVADWNSCMRQALEGAAGVPAHDARRLLAAYHQAELELQAGPDWRRYREVLTDGLARAAQRERIELSDGAEDVFVTVWPDMPVFEDAGPALAALRDQGWRLAFLTNCDDDLFATTRPRLPVPFDLWVTAQEVRSYKPDLPHFRTFAEKTGATNANWIHVGNSWVHDVFPATRMGLRTVWVDRDLTGHPAKLADRRVTSMRRLPEAVSDVSAIPPRLGRVAEQSTG